MAKSKIKGLTPRFKYFVLFVCAVYTVAILISQEIEMGKQKAQIAQLTQQKEEATVAKEFAEENLIYVLSNEYIEKVAREKLGWVKEGEIKFFDRE